MIRHIPLAFIMLLSMTMPCAADEEQKTFSAGGDRFLMGRHVIFEQAGTEDLFAAGEFVHSRADIVGSIHLAGRKVTMEGAVGGDAYMAGMDVVLDASVGGDATLTGYNVTVGGVGGNLRVSGGNLQINGPVAGYALIGGETIILNGHVAGDAIITARDLKFGGDAHVGGRLTVFEEDPGTLSIPESVASEDQILRRDIREWEDATKDLDLVDWRNILGRFLLGVIFVAALASMVAAVIPKTLADLREGLLERPFRNLLFGFLTQSALIGGAIVLLVTVIGIVASPAAILAALIAGMAGYVVAVYAFGVGLMVAFGRPLPKTTGSRAVSAGLGALAVGLIAAIPVLGWIFVVVLTLAGIGAITLKTLRPAFFVST